VKTVAIFGVGLIGGSFGLAIRKAGFRGTILGVSSPKTLERALQAGAIDRGAPAGEAAAEADLILLAQPVHAILKTIPSLAGRVRPGALVTDAGSTKAQIAEAGRKALPGGYFLGGHPLAGKERRGVDAAEAGLFTGRTWVITPAERAELGLPQVRDFVQLLESIGALPTVLEAEEHDRILAFTSHLPQLASTALSAALSAELVSASAGGHPLFGPALLDSTRLGLSPFSVWGDILDTNRTQIRAALRCYIIKLQEVMESLDENRKPDLERQFEAAAQFSRLLRQPEIEGKQPGSVTKLNRDRVIDL
jgi:prephenate dehydrogenase